MSFVPLMTYDIPLPTLISLPSLIHLMVGMGNPEILHCSLRSLLPGTVTSFGMEMDSFLAGKLKF